MSYTKSTRDSDLGLNEDFAPPPGPPPPIMPEGWVARFDERYQRFYYVNTYTKQSQWEKPPGTIDPPALGRSPTDFDRPPAYNSESSRREDRPVTPTPQQKYESLLPPQPQQQQQQYLQPPRPQTSTSGSSSPSRGLSGRLSSFLKSHAAKSPRPQQQQYYYQQQQLPVYYGGGGGMMGGQRRPGMGAGGAAALGVGGGLLGGMLLADAMDDHQYDQGFEDGQDYGGGGEFGGDMDFGGGDF
ncbi:uncharacterized protein H6S33_011243 [Morchella sextelata]|uniref:uncharacterized protein n=1 Tax=Morchella sextelata TaxID=1174677 RepID=UPI001D0574F1|nr:uncharacterized protein H6S33_011243 [Morchella sextelata]KAH0610816.1 hypothetical protein H6S33_011243 [Morchella sextelata]